MDDALNRIDARERLILALDVPNDPANPRRLIEASDARQLVEELDDLVSFVKIGWPLYLAGGHGLIREFLKRGKRVFLDLKFGDIAETVKRLVLVAVNEGVTFVTLNTSFAAVRAAIQARGDSKLKILAVTMGIGTTPDHNALTIVRRKGKWYVSSLSLEPIGKTLMYSVPLQSKAAEREMEASTEVVPVQIAGN